MSEQNAPRTPYVAKDPTRDWNLRIKGVTLEGADRPTTISFEIYNGRPRIVYRTNLPGTPQETMVTAAFSLHGFNDHLVLLERVIKGEQEGFMTETKGNPIMPDGSRSHEIKTLVRIKVERNHEGVITYNVAGGKGFEPAHFELLPDEYHHFCNADRSPMDPKLVSEIVAQGIVNTWRPVMAVLACNVEGATPPRTQDGGQGGQGNQGGGGGYQNRQGGAGGNQWRGNQGGGNNQWRNNNNRQGGGNNNWRNNNNRQGGGGNNNWRNNNQGGGGGGYQKKQWNNNQGGGGNNQWRNNNQGSGNNQGGQKQYNEGSFDNDIPF